MIAVITGDIVNSREHKDKNWLSLLKAALQKFGNEPMEWEIYRGDSFQLKVKAKKGLAAALYIKSCIKTEDSLDVRMAIGVGEINSGTLPITEHQGEAFVRSGMCFEKLKSSRLAIDTGNEFYNQTLNTMMDLGSLTFDNWSTVDAITLKTALENPNSNQKEIAKELKKSSSTVNFSLQKAGYNEIKKLLEYYEKSIDQL